MNSFIPSSGAGGHFASGPSRSLKQDFVHAGACSVIRWWWGYRCAAREVTLERESGVGV